MALDLARATRTAHKHISQLDYQRTQSGEPVEFVCPRDAMITLNSYWQDMCLSLRKGESAEIYGAAAAIRLAAAALKFATDLGIPCCLDTLTHFDYDGPKKQLDSGLVRGNKPVKSGNVEEAREE